MYTEVYREIIGPAGYHPKGSLRRSLELGVAEAGCGAGVRRLQSAQVGTRRRNAWANSRCANSRASRPSRPSRASHATTTAGDGPVSIIGQRDRHGSVAKVDHKVHVGQRRSGPLVITLTRRVCILTQQSAQQLPRACMRTCVCMHACMYAWMRVCMCMCVCKECVCVCLYKQPSHAAQLHWPRIHLCAWRMPRMRLRWWWLIGGGSPVRCTRSMGV